MRRNVFFILTLASIFLIPIYANASPTEGLNTWVEQHLSASNTSFTSYLFLFLGGILASLLPCTYPLYPITINLLKSKGDNKSIAHPVAYYIGIVCMYFLFGVIASLTGGAFNTILHFPVTNLIIAIIIFLLGLSSLDLLLISLFSGSNASNAKSGVFITFLMGMSAGLLSSACVGPVVVSILIGIASNTSTFSIITMITAASKMLLFGIGVGLPFLIIGVFGFKLPKSGKWMKYIQLALGALIIYFAYIYFEKALLGFQFAENTIMVIAVSLIVIFYAHFKYQGDDILVYDRTKKSINFVLIVVGCALLFKYIQPNTEQKKLSNGTISNENLISPKTEQKGNLTWYLDKDAAYAAAKEKSKPVFIDFHADWCTNCKEFQKTTQNNKALNEALANNAVLLKVYEGSATFKQFANDPKFPELKVGLPFFIITDKDNNLLYKTNDYLKSDEMIMFLSN
jgi:thiol:disulfide interchange protein DsbD